MQENSYWHDKALTYYKSRLFQGVRVRWGVWHPAGAQDMALKV